LRERIIGRLQVINMNKVLLTLAVFCLTPEISDADDTLVRLLEKLKPSVVAIETDKGTGTGFLVGAGKVVTNHHVIAGADEVYVKFSDRKKVQADGTYFLDQERDIAILKIPTEGISAAPLAVAAYLPKQGQDVIALGNPRGFEFTVTRGIVSSVRTAAELNDILGDDDLAGTWVQTDAAISPGNSGGPLVNHGGQVIAMNTFYRADSQNLNFAISSVDISAALAKSENGKVLPFPPADKPKPKSSGDVDYSIVLKPFLARFKTGLPDLTSAEFEDAKKGNYSGLFAPVAIGSVKSGQLARIQDSSTVIQILEDGALVKIGTTKCLILFLEGEGAALRAKLGDDVIRNVPVDDLYFVGKPRAYKTVGGSTSYLLPMLPVAALPEEEWKTPIKALVQQEIERRKDSKVATAQAYLDRMTEKLTRTFKDRTGKFSVKATAVLVQDGAVTMVRASNNQTITVMLSHLSADDTTWISANETWIRLYGSRIKSNLTQN